MLINPNKLKLHSLVSDEIKNNQIRSAFTILKANSLNPFAPHLSNEALWEQWLILEAFIEEKLTCGKQ